MFETMKLLGSTKNKDENGEHKSHLEIAEIVLVHCNFINNIIYNSRVLHTFVSNKSKTNFIFLNFIFLKTFNSEFSYIKV